ncbi:ABC transporter permease [Enterococcus gilvus]|uniref:ABC transporter permease n=1 Tax=Enterococcus gilvus TaxID=160453 RepID=UPI0028D0A929|nr:ABC transporter permease [Enterococcus gilvus]
MFKDLISFFKEIIQNRTLLKQFSVNDFKARYAGSALGIFWAFANPLVMVVTYWFVFGVGFKAAMTDGKYPFIVFLLTGLVPWMYFSEVLGSATNVFREYSYLVKKVVFNIRILPSVKLFSAMYMHVFFIIIALIVGIFNHVVPGLHILQMFYYLFAMMMFLTGLTWITSSIQPFFPDINQFIGVIMQALMWGTPVLWSINQFAAHPTIQFILKFNPMFYVVQGYRDAFFGEQWFWEKPLLTIYFWAVTLILLVVGSIVFKRLKPHFSDVL